MKPTVSVLQVHAWVLALLSTELPMNRHLDEFWTILMQKLVSKLAIMHTSNNNSSLDASMEGSQANNGVQLHIWVTKALVLRAHQQANAATSKLFKFFNNPAVGKVRSRTQ